VKVVWRGLVAGLVAVLGVAGFAVPGSAAGTQHVLLIGDSLMEQSAPYWQQSMSYVGKNVVVTSAAVGGTGLLYADSWSRFVGALDAHPETNVVVVEFIGNCFANAPVEPVACGAGFGTPWYYALSDYVQDRMVAEARARGMQIRWIASPPIDEYVWIGPVFAQLRAQTISNMASLGVPMTDWARDLSYDGGTSFSYIRWLQHFGAPVCLCYVRTGDGVHMTPDGAQYVAESEAVGWAP
jgi:membrane protein implicated in regulation of membrane protease activity